MSINTWIIYFPSFKPIYQLLVSLFSKWFNILKQAEILKNTVFILLLFYSSLQWLSRAQKIIFQLLMLVCKTVHWMNALFSTIPLMTCIFLPLSVYSHLIFQHASLFPFSLCKESFSYVSIGIWCLRQWGWGMSVVDLLVFLHYLLIFYLEGQKFIF